MEFKNHSNDSVNMFTNQHNIKIYIYDDEQTKIAIHINLICWKEWFEFQRHKEFDILTWLVKCITLFFKQLWGTYTNNI